MFVMGLGISVTTRAGLGTSPISSLPYTFTFLTPLSFGMTTFLVNMVFITTQRLLLGKAFPAVQYFQILLLFVFAAAIDLTMWLTGFLVPTNYFGAICMTVLGCAILALGIALELHADFLLTPGEGVVKAICHFVPLRIATVKMIFDSSLVVLSLVLLLVFLGRIEGIREGTLISAFAVGFFLRFLIRLTRPLRRWILCRRRVKGF